MFTRIRNKMQGGDISGGPAVAIIALVVVLIAAIFLWRDYAATNQPSPNALTPGSIIPNMPGVPEARPAPTDKKTSAPSNTAPR